MFWKGVYSKRKIFVPKGLFLKERVYWQKEQIAFRVDHFLEGRQN